MKVLDLFSGIGGFSLGLERAGMETVMFCEKDKFCQKVLRKHWPDVPVWDDVKTLKKAHIDDAFNRKYPGKRCQDMGKLKKLSDENVEEAKNLYQQGFSFQEVGEFFGVSRQAIWELLKSRGVEPRPQKREGKDNHFYRGGSFADPKVHNITEKAIGRGILKPGPCEVCGEKGKMADGRNMVQAHHDDYNKPLEVRWLCQKHHHEWHKKYRAIKRSPEPAQIDVVCGGFP